MAKGIEIFKASDAPPKNPTVQIGDTGLQQAGGFVREEFLPELMGGRGARIYREMRDNDAVIGAAMQSAETLLRQVQWNVDAADPENPDDMAAVEFLEEQWDRIDPPNFIASALSFLVYGWAIFETIYERVDGRLMWKEFAERSQESLIRWEFDDDGKIVGMWQRLKNGSEVLIPCEKALHIRTTKVKNNPEGRSVLRSAYRSWYFKKRIEEVEGIGIERDMAGLPKFTVPGNWTNQDDPNHSLYIFAQKMATRIRRDEQEGLVLPDIRDIHGNKIFDFELVSSGGRRQFDTNAIISRFDSRIAMALLADFLMLGHDKTGSFALASTKTDLFAAGLGSWLDIIESAVNHEAAMLMRMNGMRGMAYLRHGDIEAEDVSPMVENIERMLKVGGLSPTEDVEQHVRELLNLPQLEAGAFEDEDDPVPDPPAEPEPPQEDPPAEDDDDD